MTDIDSTVQAQESRLRREARRQGLQLHKSRTRETRAIEYNRFHIADAASNTVVAGGHPCAYSMDLDAVEEFLRS